MVPYTLAELTAALDVIGGFERRPLVAVGVSGGPDSLALLLLTERWARQNGGAAWGLIVDHRLRPDSTEEAERVAGWLAARGITYRILPWTGDKPATGVQEAARAARYRLLARECARLGCLHLFSAHHRDDQAETYLIRRRAGSGPGGLAGMSAIRELPDCRLLRPLLAVPRARLHAFLKAEGQPFVSDPSNRNPVFERSRLRLSMTTAEPDDGIVTEMRRLGRYRADREARLAETAAAAVALHPAGLAVIDVAAIHAASDDLAQALLGRVAATIGGSLYPLRRDRVARLQARLRATGFAARTLGGCRFVPWRDHVLVLREFARTSSLPLQPGNRAVWDRRFEVELPGEMTGPVTIGPLGEDGVAELGRAAREASELPRLAHPALPALRDWQGLWAVPHLRWWRDATARRLRITFRPTNALTPGAFAVV